MTVDAMTGLATGKKTERPQDILTPEVVVEFTQYLWNDTIALDPCATLDSRNRVHAVFRYCGPDAGHVDGLTTMWMDRTFVNPPYKNLREWMAKTCFEAALRPVTRIVMLCPVRGHRAWWHDVADTAVKVELAPLKFVGYEGSFPAPLCLLVWGSSVEEVHVAVERSGLRVTKITPPCDCA